MKPTSKIFFTGLAILSLLILMSSTVAWVRSYHAGGVALTPQKLEPGRSQLLTWRGEFILVHHAARVDPPWELATTMVYNFDCRNDLTQCCALIEMRSPYITILDAPIGCIPGPVGKPIVLSGDRKHLVTVAKPGRVYNSGGFGVNIFRFYLRVPSTQPSNLQASANTSVILWSVAVPCWLPMLIGSIIPLRVTMLHRRKLRARLAGMCCCCNYDLRATPDRCPECGSVPSTVKA